MLYINPDSISIKNIRSTFLPDFRPCPMEGLFSLKCCLVNSKPMTSALANIWYDCYTYQNVINIAAVAVTFVRFDRPRLAVWNMSIARETPFKSSLPMMHIKVRRPIVTMVPAIYYKSWIDIFDCLKSRLTYQKDSQKGLQGQWASSCGNVDK